MTVAQHMSEQAYQAFVLSGAEGAWELHDGHDGRLVEKPGVTCLLFPPRMANRFAAGQAC